MTALDVFSVLAVAAVTLPPPLALAAFALTCGICLRASSEPGAKE